MVFSIKIVYKYSLHPILIFLSLVDESSRIKESIRQFNKISQVIRSFPTQNTEYKMVDIRSQEELEETRYGWLVVVASFLCNMVIDGMGYSFGMMLQPLMQELSEGAGWVSFVGSLQTGVYLLSSLLAAAITNKYTYYINSIL